MAGEIEEALIALDDAATPAVSRSPTNIQAKAWVRNAAESSAAGRTPRLDGVDGVAYGLWFGVKGFWFGTKGFWFGPIVFLAFLRVAPPHRS